MTDQFVLYVLSGCGLGISIATWFRPLHVPFDKRFRLTRFVAPVGTVFVAAFAMDAPLSRHIFASIGIYALIGVVITTGWAIYEVLLTVKERHLKK